MRPKSLILLALALGCGLVASIGISQVMESRRQQKAGDQEQTNILVAMGDIERNAELTAQNVTLKPWPKTQVPAGAITKIEDVIGRRPDTRIIKDEPILEGKLGTGEGGKRASTEIPAGYRVVPVRMENSQNTGLILPGDRVDVQVFVNKGSNVPEATTKTFLKDVSVFAVNSEIRHDPATDAKIDAKTISLLLTPQQADKLTLAESVGNVRLVLRGSQSEKAIDDDAKITLGGILGTESESGGQTSKAPAADLKAFLDKQPVGKPAEAALEPEKNVFKMVIVHGSEAHVEELHEGELLPRRMTTDGEPATPPAHSADMSAGEPQAPAAAVAPPTTVPSGNAPPTSQPTVSDSSSPKSPAANPRVSNGCQASAMPAEIFETTAQHHG